MTDDGRSHAERVEGGYYIYGLVDPRALRDTNGDTLLSVFYVGKGKGTRWSAHEEQVRISLRREEERPERRGSKDERIRRILERGERVQAVRLSAGYTDERDAYYAEALAIDTVAAALAAAGRPPLANATPGHHAGFVWLGEHFTFTAQEEADIDTAVTSDDTARAAKEILVKGKAEDFVAPAQRRTGREALPPRFADLSERVVAIDLLDADHPETRVRRGWDPLDPWSDDEARERAYRYWPVAAGTVESWIREPDSAPAHLLLGIPGPRGQTVVRYAWSLDPRGVWEYYQNIGRWGVPLGSRKLEHPRLGSALYETRNGHRVQVLYGYSSGIRILDGL